MSDKRSNTAVLGAEPRRTASPERQPAAQDDQDSYEHAWYQILKAIAESEGRDDHV